MHAYWQHARFLPIQYLSSISYLILHLSFCACEISTKKLWCGRHAEALSYCCELRTVCAVNQRIAEDVPLHLHVHHLVCFLYDVPCAHIGY